MSNSKIYANSDTIISKNLSDSNFSSLNYLAVGESESNYKCTDVIISLLKFDLSNVVKENSVTKVELYLYLNCESIKIKNSKFNLMLYRNRQDYNYKTVTWNTAPKTVNTECVYSISGSNVGKYVKIDITAIVKKWLDRSCPNYGIALVGNESRKLLFLSSSRGQNRPYLVIYDNGGIPCYIDSTGAVEPKGETEQKGGEGIQGPDGGAGEKGVQGLTGTTEIQGETGFQENQGVTGAIVKNNNAQFVTISAAKPIPIKDNDYIELGNVKIEGTNITHVNGSTDVIVQGVHTYYAFWNIVGSSSSAPSIFEGVLELNGDNVQGSLGSSGTIIGAQDKGSATGAAIFTTSAGSNMLKLKYMTYTGVTNAVCFASLSIVELA